jgi:hypothetical protein
MTEMVTQEAPTTTLKSNGEAPAGYGAESLWVETSRGASPNANGQTASSKSKEKGLFRTRSRLVFHLRPKVVFVRFQPVVIICRAPTPKHSHAFGGGAVWIQTARNIKVSTIEIDLSVFHPLHQLGKGNI